LEIINLLTSAKHPSCSTNHLPTKLKITTTKHRNFKQPYKKQTTVKRSESLVYEPFTPVLSLTVCRHWGQGCLKLHSIKYSMLSENNASRLERLNILLLLWLYMPHLFSTH